MKAYKTYQEAKINNPNSVIVVFIKPGNEHHGRFEAQITDGIGSQLMHPSGHWHICKPADYLPSLEWFFDEGHALKNGDLISDRNGNVIEVGKVNVTHRVLDEGYVLRAAALTEMKVITESPEEKEALDAIKEIDLDCPVTKIKIGKNESVGFRLKSGSDDSEWKNGDKCITGSGEKIYIAPYPFEKDIHILADEQCVHRAHISVIKKPESQEQKADRERLESAYDLWLTWCSGCDVDNSLSIEQFSTLGCCDGYLAIVDKTGHRKEK